MVGAARDAPFAHLPEYAARPIRVIASEAKIPWGVDSAQV